MTTTMVNDLREGIDGTEIRAGLIGEIGCVGDPITGLTVDDEKRLLSTVKAQNETGVSVNIHPPMPMQGSEAKPVLKMLEKEGAHMQKVAISHMDKPSALQHQSDTRLDYIEEISFLRRLYWIRWFWQ